MPQVAKSAPDALADAPDLLAELTQLLMSEGRRGEARSTLGALAALGSRDPRVDLLGGLLDFAEGRYTGAEAKYRRLLTADPEHDIARAFLAESLVAQRRWREAEGLLAEVQGADRNAAAVRFAAELSAGLGSGLFQRTDAG
ncbi:MAG: tetratricopeptide repeat protein [Acidobacteriota bacterium]